MVTLYNRFNPARLLGYIFSRDLPPTGDASAYRRELYDRYQEYFDNTIYNRREDGGSRDTINKSLGRLADADIAGFYNPVSEIVDLYQHVFGGEFGKTITVETDNPKLITPASVGGRLVPSPIERIWKWSNIDQQKQILCRTAALTGNCGLRIVVEDDPDITRRRVYIKPEHPRIIRDLDTDARGNITQILFRYDEITGIGDAQKAVTIEELQTKAVFTRWYVQNGMRDQTPFEDYVNDLGVVPYVLLAHQPTGGDWGQNAFYRSIVQIDRLNKLVAHINTQIEDHVRVNWFMAISGKAPQKIELDGTNVIYVDTTTSNGTPLMTPMVAPLSLADAIEEARDLYGQIVEKQPELKAILGQFLSNQSGETVKELRKPAEDKLGLARSNYEDAVNRAEDIGLSLGVLHGMWDIGTGMGTVDAAERAYHDGYEAHRYNTRPLLPIADDEQRIAFASQMKALQAAGMTFAAAAKELGKDDVWIRQSEKVEVMRGNTTE